MLAGRLTEVLREIGKLTGELGTMAGAARNQRRSHLLNSPLVANLQASMLRALAPFPDARVAVVAALRAMDADGVPPPIKTIEHAALSHE